MQGIEANFDIRKKSIAQPIGTKCYDTVFQSN